MAFETTVNQHRWFQACVTKVKEDDTYDIEFNDPEWYQEEEDFSASQMRKIPKNKGAAEKFKGMGVWAFDSMSDSDAEDWRSDEEDLDAPETVAEESKNVGSRKKRSRQKQKLTFRQFWELRKIVDALSGNKSLSIQLLRSIAGLEEEDDDGFRAGAATAAASRGQPGLVVK